MAKTYIIGHQKPDTDSVVAALALAELGQNCNCLGHENPTAAIADPLNPETAYLFDKFEVKAPPQISATDINPEDKVVLVDHNEESQRLPGIKPGQIIEIVDHHKANLNLSRPIFMSFKAWGSSATIVYFMMKQLPEKAYRPEKKLATLMLSAILSDTVGFKSATTTEKDKQLGQELAEIAGVDDPQQLALEIFKAKSNLDDLSDSELVINDYKEYNFTQKVGIGQIETVEQAQIISQRKEGLLKAIEQVKQKNEIDLLFLAVTDVLKVNTKLLLADQTSQKIAEQTFGGQTQDGVLDIGPRMSRKKQIAPEIEKKLAS